MRRTTLVVATLLLASFALSTAAALPADRHIDIEADDGQGCTSDQKVDCFRVTNGSLEGLMPGMRLHIQLENVGSNPHNIYGGLSADADENHVDTPASAAINSSDTIEPGQMANLTLTIPSDAEGLYLWCDVDGHETLGMWLNATVEQPEDTNDTGDDGGMEGNQTDDGSMDGGDGEEENDMPLAPWLAILGFVGAATLFRRR